MSTQQTPPGMGTDPPRNRTPRPRLEEYARKYADTFQFERNNGVLEVYFHTNGGAGGGSGWYDVWSQAWWEIGNDPANEVIIISGRGEQWLDRGPRTRAACDINNARPTDRPDELLTDERSFNSYIDALKNTENIVFGINVPTIAAINGPAELHFEIALMCDLTLCTEATVLRDMHYSYGLPPGDGLGLAFQELLGTKRAAYYLYLSESIDAQTALRMGLVNEVLPAGRLMPRAREIAARIMRAPRMTRLMTKQIIRRRWARRHLEDAAFGMAHEALAIATDRPFPYRASSLTPERVEWAREDRARWDEAVERARKQADDT